LTSTVHAEVIAVAQDSSNLTIKVTLLPLAFSLRVRMLLFCDDDRGTVKYETRDVYKCTTTCDGGTIQLMCAGVQRDLLNDLVCDA